MTNVWMIRAGEHGRLISEFARGYVGIGWSNMGDMAGIKSQDDMREKYLRTYPDAKPGMVGNAVAMAYKFCKVICIGDKVISYNPTNRQYLVGTVKSEYKHAPGTIEDYPNIRAVEWQGNVDRDALHASSRNSLGSTLTLFAVNEEVWADISGVIGGKPIASIDSESEEESDLLVDIKDRSKEFIKDRIARLDPYELQDLVAGVLRAMGYKTRVSQPGPDRGVDILASPDGFGFEQPRIVVECKHRGGAIGAQDIRSFLGGRHKDDKGLYVSTGGFSKDARYEAERASIPVALMDMDRLVEAIVEHYENMDTETRVLIPLVKIYWPA